MYFYYPLMPALMRQVLATLEKSAQENPRNMALLFIEDTPLQHVLAEAEWLSLRMRREAYHYSWSLWANFDTTRRFRDR